MISIGNIPQGGPSSMSLDSNSTQVASNEMNSESADDDLPF